MEYIGIIEFQDNKGEYHDFTIVKEGDNLIAGSPTNACFLRSYKMRFDTCFSLDENLQGFVEDIECHVNGSTPSGDLIVIGE